MTEPTPTPGAPVPPDGLATFTEWFCRNYPGPDTIIHKPEWHAPKVFRAAQHAINAQAMQEQAELARIVFDLLELIEPRWEYDWRGNATNAHPDDFALTVRARAAAEQLRGGGSDG